MATHKLDSYRRERGFSSQSCILDIERAQRAKRIALSQCAERTCTIQRSCGNAVLERLGLSIQKAAISSPRPPAHPRWGRESSRQEGRRIGSVLNVTPLKHEEKNQSRTNHTSEKNSPFIERKLQLASKMFDLTCKIAEITARGRNSSTGRRSTRTSQMLEEDLFFESKLELANKVLSLNQQLVDRRERDRSPSPVDSEDSFSSVSTHTPYELKAISLLESSTSWSCSPSPHQISLTRNPRARPPLEASGAIKAGDRGDYSLVQLPSIEPPAPTRRMALIQVPQSTAAQTKDRRPRCVTNLLLPKAEITRNVGDNLQTLVNPSEKLPHFFRQLSSKDWEKKMDGLKSVKVLARHHPELLKTKLHEVCLILTEEVKNLRSAVACAAMDVITDLHVYLGKAMDTEAERTGCALLLKLAQTTSLFIQKQANVALDALVKSCSPPRVLSALLNTGLNHRCVAVRGSAAQHLHQLADIIGQDQILTTGKTFAAHFTTAVCKMALDAAPEVRHHAHRMLQGLVQQSEFTALFNKLIPMKDRHPLKKIVIKLKPEDVFKAASTSI